MAKKKRSSRKVAGKRLAKKSSGGTKGKGDKAHPKKPGGKHAGSPHPPTPGPLGSPKERAIAMLRFARGVLERTLADWPEDKHTAQGGAGCENHAIWTVGHVAVNLARYFAPPAAVEMPELPSNYETLFRGVHTPPTDDPSMYPPLREVKEWLDRVTEAFIAGIEAQSDDELATDVSESMGGFTTDRLQLVEQAAWHEGWHAGQLAALRRVLGLRPIFGTPKDE